MRTIFSLLAVMALLPDTAALAGEQPAAGKLLVATGDVDGSSFERTVILLLHYDETGAQGLVINRRSDAELAEVFPGSEILANSSGALFWGGPVRMTTMRALLRTVKPPPDAVEVIPGVHQVPLDGDPEDYRGDAATLRFYAGYAGWAPGQLDHELRLGSWDVVAASADIVFAANPESVWRTVRPLPELRVRNLWSGHGRTKLALQVAMHDGGADRITPDIGGRAETIEEPVHRQQ